ncbi:S66 peptidase family protein [Aegicerativicinus sediminis]|uniref:S66 peptidase family protein n=1 Tax=Aegicerativicinus sediminis TaxID=2893202 RepID=UPI001E60858F|nr:LD-carboxypeptidase [Aegicerativicinus sediminis]
MLFISRKNLLLLHLFIAAISCLPAQPNVSASIEKIPASLISPPYLKPGDTVAIVSPSGVLKNREEHIARGIALMESWGLNVVLGKNLYKTDNHFAGTDEERAADMQWALDNPSIKAIWSSRGGYGTVRILDKLDYTEFKKHPKWVIGYSDITALHLDIHNLGYQTIHAMMGTSLGEDQEDMEETISTFKKTLLGEKLEYHLDGSDYNRTGMSEGELIGGNLTLLHTMLGSRSSINADDKILFIEDVGEYKYHIDRMLQSLKRAGYFDHCKGVIVGDFSNMRKNTTEWGSSIEQLILDALKDYDFPIAFNMPSGHEDDNRALYFGRLIKLKVTKDETVIEFAKR